MQSQPRKWVMEISQDGDTEMVRVLLVGDKEAELQYIAMDEEGAKKLIASLEWFESFNAGIVSIPPPPKPKRKPAPRKRTLVLEFEPEPPKPKRKS